MNLSAEKLMGSLNLFVQRVVQLTERMDVKIPLINKSVIPDTVKLEVLWPVNEPGSPFAGVLVQA